MSRVLSFALFFLVALAITGAVHYYLWARLVRDVDLGPVPFRVLTGLFIALFLSVPLTFALSTTLPAERARPILLCTYGWMGLMFFLLVLVAGADLVRLVVRVGELVAGRPPLDPGKRLTLARLLAGGVLLVTAGMGAAAVRGGLGRVIVRNLRVRLSRLPKELDGLTIVQLSDIHLGPTLGREFMQDIVARTNALEPDVIAITGDLVDGSVEHLGEHVAPIADLRARHGVFFVTGNHEYYSGPVAWCRELERLGIRVLRNERVSIGNGTASFDLAGTDDYNAARFGHGHGEDLERALADRDESRELVLLAHQPRTIKEAQRYGVGLQLSGHTHGGQIWPWNYLVYLQQPVVSGLARFGRSQVYVSNGTGYWGPPMRLGAPAEITRVTLEAEARS